MKEVERILSTNKMRSRSPNRQKQNYSEIHKSYMNLKPHDKTQNRHCYQSKGDHFCITEEILERKNVWTKEEKSYFVMKTMKISYQHMMDELQFLRVLKILNK